LGASVSWACPGEDHDCGRGERAEEHGSEPESEDRAESEPADQRGDPWQPGAADDLNVAVAKDTQVSTVGDDLVLRDVALVGHRLAARRRWDAGGAGHLWGQHSDPVDVAPGPLFVRFERADDRVPTTRPGLISSMALGP
jgi:hypothetical protein